MRSRAPDNGRKRYVSRFGKVLLAGTLVLFVWLLGQYLLPMFRHTSDKNVTNVSPAPQDKILPNSGNVSVQAFREYLIAARSGSEGTWASYEIVHNSKGNTQGDKPQSVDSQLEFAVNTSARARFFVFWVGERFVAIPAKIQARVESEKTLLLSVNEEIPRLDVTSVLGNISQMGFFEFDQLFVEMALDNIGKPQLVKNAKPLSWIGPLNHQEPSSQIRLNLFNDLVRVFDFNLPNEQNLSQFLTPTSVGGLGFSVQEQGSKNIKHVNYKFEEVSKNSENLASLQNGNAVFKVTKTFNSESFDMGLASKETAKSSLVLVRGLFLPESIFSEATELFLNANSKISETHYSWTVTLMEKGRLSAQDVKLLFKKMQETNLKYAAGAISVLRKKQPNLERQSWKEELGEDNLSSLLEKIQQLANAQDQGETAKTALYLKIKALLFLYPDQSSQLVEQVKEAAASSLELQLVAGALSAVGTLEAQLALKNWIDHSPSGSAKRHQLIPMLGLSGQPVPETLAYLEAQSRLSADKTDREIAFLSLGIAANKAMKNQVSLGEPYLDYIRYRLRAAQSEQEIMLALAAAGNTGDPEVLKNASLFLSSNWQRVRAQAVLALRQGAFKDFENSFRKGLSDKSVAVRRATVEALSAQPPSLELSQLLLSQMQTETDKRVRLKLLRLIWANRKINLEAETFIRATSQLGGDNELRSEAIGLLEQASERKY